MGVQSPSRDDDLYFVMICPCDASAMLQLFSCNWSPSREYQQLGRRLMSGVPVWATAASPLRELLDVSRRIEAASSMVDGIPYWNEPMEGFTITLELLKAALHKWALRPATQRNPVLFIDEAHLLADISKRPGDAGSKALRSFFDWCVLNTKQEGRFHVVFASTDSLFLDWLGAQGIGPHIRPVVVGDLDQERARAYYQHRLELANVPSDVVVPPFDEMYRVCGGHVISIRTYVRDAVLAATMPRQQGFVFSDLPAARARRGMAVPPPNDVSRGWSRNQILAVYTAIHRDGWLKHSDAENLVGESAVKALLKAGAVHLRPQRPIVADLPNQPATPVLTAMTPVERVAMGRIVSEER